MGGGRSKICADGNATICWWATSDGTGAAKGAKEPAAGPRLAPSGWLARGGTPAAGGTMPEQVATGSCGYDGGGNWGGAPSRVDTGDLSDEPDIVGAEPQAAPSGAVAGGGA